MKSSYTEPRENRRNIMLSQRQFALLNCLRQQDEPLQVDDVARQMNISSRTVQRYVETINQELAPYESKIILQRGIGYTLENVSNALIEMLENKQDILEDPKSRIEWLILYIIEKGPIKVDALSELLSLSPSFLTKETNDIKAYLKKYQLQLTSKPCYGLQIVGKELNIRTLLTDIGFQYNQSKVVGCNLLNISETEFNDIDKVISAYLQEHTIIVADRDIYELWIRITISLSRCRAHHKMQDLAFPKGLRYHNFQMIYQIMSKLAHTFNVSLSEEEYNYISIYSGFMLYSFDPAQLDIEKDLHEFVYESVQEISLLSGIDYIEDEHVINALAVHLKVLLNRLEKQVKLKNPLLDQIKKDYPMEMNYAIYLTRKIEDRFGLHINEEEIGYFAVHFSAHKEKIRHKRSAVILCNYGLGTSQLIGERIRQEIVGIEIVGIYPVHYLELALAQEVDFIISTIPINEDTKDKKVIVVDNLLALDAFDKIKQDMDKQEDRSHLLVNLFHPHCFYHSSLHSKEEVFHFLYQKCKELKIEDHVMHSIIEREQVSATDIGNLVAIPHAICEGDFTSCIVVVILDKPILWDKEMVQMVLMICFNQRDKDNAALFRELYRCIKSMTKVHKMIDAKDYQTFIELIR